MRAQRDNYLLISPKAVIGLGLGFESCELEEKEVVLCLALLCSRGSGLGLALGFMKLEETLPMSV